jgi:hypothetical protein
MTATCHQSCGEDQKNLAPLGPVDRATNHQPQGRQSAVDKKRGQSPGKDTAARFTKPPGGTAWPQNKKPQFPYARELRIAPVLLGPQVGSRPVSREPVRPSHRQVFWLLDHSTPGAFPGSASTPVALSRFRPQLQRRDRDGFAPSSLSPMGPVSSFNLSCLTRHVKGDHRGPGEHQGVYVHPQGLGHRGAFGLEEKPDAGVA